MFIKHYQHFNSNANHLKVDIYNSGYAELNQDKLSHDFAGSMCRLYFIESGEGEIAGNDQAIHFRPGHVYFIPSGVSWNMQFRVTIRKFFVDLNVFKPDGENLFEDCSSILEIPFPEDKLAQTIEWYLSEQTEKMFFVKSVVYQLLAEIIRASRIESPTVKYHPIVLDSLKYIQKHLSLKLTVQVLAERNFVSKSFLSSQFKKEIGVSVGQYIDTRIVMQAKIELEQQKMSVAEISEQFGFCDQFYFSRFFKRHTGETPSQYRSHYTAQDYYLSKDEE
ncbi:MAG: helix-turn-helix transcriptional regulator [Clostridia bacterium]|nr:helix-turn-helix transcriptional regulator [Clostridia bacterium]